MAASTALPDALSTFTTATDAALHSLPESSTLVPPKDGITLLDTKTDIFLAYLQALALRNLNVIRSIKDGGDTTEAQELSNEITRKLVEHRVYLERGVRPLEGKIKYQVDKVVKAADDEARASAQKAQSTAAAAATNGRARANTDGSDDSDEDAAADDIATDSFRPNPAAFAQQQQQQATGEDAYASRRAKSHDDGVYRPPRISATAMPTTESRERKERSRPERSRTVDEYISTELNAAPVAQPSIGSTITEGGRRTKDSRVLAKEAERREYEETNLVRLPKESSKAAGKKGALGARDRGGYGGEEWRDLGASVDRIGELTRRRGGKEGVLEKSRKRRAGTEDGPRDSGIGGAFEVKRKRMEKKTRR
ncbi:hypothetical protein LTR36_006211 [Oleoguttula mirabilis]|uniref:Uncharacterized protein n=1 Tax=Oleoguttula mirabilis TaxID=1507867 RepID=A0AAV9JD82_9PEZI|nr:hypothetical protein LTR36_006211 [Oleoguttula mirabilis]